MRELAARIVRFVLAHPAAQLCLLLAVTTLVNFGVFQDGFYWDDRYQILEGRLNRDWSSIPEIFTSEVWRNVETTGRLELATIDTYRPLFNLSLLVDYQIAGSAPRWYHLVNLLIHLANVALVFQIGRRLFQDRAGLGVAALFALHPSTITCIHYVSARPDSASTMFGLLAVVLAVAPARPTARTTAAMAASYLCAILWKETALTFALLVPVSLWVARPQTTLRQVLVPGAVLLAVACAYLALRSYALGSTKAVADAAHAAQMVANFPAVVLTFARAVVFDVVPLPLRAFDTASPPYSALRWIAVAAFYSVVGAGMIVGVVRRWSLASALWWVILGLAPPTVAVVRTDIIDGHYFYLATVGPALAFGFALLHLGRSVPRPRLVAAAALAVLVTAGTLSGIAAQSFADEIAFYRGVIDAGPHSPIADYNLGNAYVRAGRVGEAIDRYRVALERQPRNASVHNNLGIALLRANQLPQATRHAARAVALDPENARYRYNLGVSLTEQGQLREGLAELARSSSLDRAYEEPRALVRRICGSPLGRRVEGDCQRILPALPGAATSDRP